MIHTHPVFTSLPLMLSLQALSYPAVAQTLPAQTLPQCERQQEIFTFQVPNYAIRH